jgi:hypothetical protein
VRAYNFLKEDRRNEAHQLLKEEEHWMRDEGEWINFVMITIRSICLHLGHLEKFAKMEK